MKILEVKSPTQVCFRLGRDKRIFWKAVNKQMHYLNRWVVEGTSKATQLRLYTLCVTTLGNIIREWITFVRLDSFEEKQGIGFNQLLDFSLQRETVLDVMVGCSLMSWQGSLGAGWEAAPHMSLRLGQTVSLKPVVEAAVDVGVRALAGIEADSAKLPVKPPGYSVSLTRPGVLLPLHECSWISCSNWYVLSFCLHKCL